MDIRFIGWCHQELHNKDKVWGLIRKDEFEYQTFWGRRGKKLQTKTRPMTDSEANKLIRTKQNKGYREFDKEELDQIHDNFKKQVFVVGLKG